MNIALGRYRELLTTYLAPQKARVALLAALLVAVTALQLWSPQLLRRFIDTATSSGAASPMRSLLTLAGLFILAALATQVLQVAATYFSELVGWTATNRLRSDLALHCLGLDLPFHNQRTAGEMIERVDGDITALSTFFSQLVLQVLGSLLLLAGVLVALLLENMLVGAVLAAFALVSLFALIQIRNVAVQALADEREARAGLYGVVEERLAGLDDIRANGAGDYTMQRLDGVMREVNRTGVDAALKSSSIWMLTMGTFTIGYALALGLGAYLYGRGAATIGTVYLFFQYTDLLRRPLEQLSEQIKQFQAATAGIGRIDELRALRSTVPDGPGRSLPPGPSGVEFDGVSFAYGSATTIDQLSFRLAPGRVLGVLGRTGSGKTTMTRLLFRLYDVAGGMIRVGDTDIRELTLEQLRGHIGIVTQEVQLFEATVRDNLTLFDPRIADERVRAALDQLGLGGWLDGLPDGLDSILEGGSGSLSAGEAQLVAFARVFLRDPAIVILDEASSRLDPATEQMIERAVDRLLDGRTGIVIAHRLGTVRRADQILLLENGRRIEYGARAGLAADETSRFAQLLRVGMEEVLA